MPFYTSRCAICQTTNKQKKQKVCDECSFINEFVTKWGRENLRAILTEYLLNKPNKKINYKIENENVKNDSQCNFLQRSNTLPSVYSNCSSCSNQNCSCHTRKNNNNFQSPCAPPYNP